MREAWRWSGPDDAVPLAHVRRDALVLKRRGAEGDHPPERLAAAARRLGTVGEGELARPETNRIGQMKGLAELRGIMAIVAATGAPETVP